MANVPARLFFVTGGALVLGAGLATLSSVHASEATLPPPEIPWNHRLPWQSYDTASLRRGYHVYREVCAQCHSLELIAWRNLVDVMFTEEEAKKMATEVEYEDGPNDDGEMFMRPGMLPDYMPKPYPNEKAARAANAGALPPDLSLIVKARVGGANYLYSLITGYKPKPAGVKIRSGMYWNPYFPGGTISMAPQLSEGMLEYEDGTEATIPQMAKDVTSFLCWASEPEHDERHKLGLKGVVLFALAIVPTVYYKRLKWSLIKTRKVIFQERM